jgi:hypothetical protein
MKDKRNHEEAKEKIEIKEKQTRRALTGETRVHFALALERI